MFRIQPGILANHSYSNAHRLLVVTAIGLIIIGRGPLYGEAAEDNWVPDLIGFWTGEGACYYFLDVSEPYLQPVYAFEGLYENGLKITHQTGRVFAGEWIRSIHQSKLAFNAAKLTNPFIIWERRNF